ncbi:hypothetical protein BY996DRAFT_6412392 [Phakopsora pachyrhizi]|uniref:Cysteine-rich transmembrane CYSTM domain-containing protein n=1 Tax=Phakopsora pachyrhizi TaxID=170000 RepID=A0AAV0BPK4_PHAPC|nr:hypothetical protein BY996DRAFT_6412392 [Phakopsora pachyrhizi]CAH7689293.1 hypothetical protein PPACK8108_LOCUS24343 [Phakopsora pachyrhizi]
MNHPNLESDQAYSKADNNDNSLAKPTQNDMTTSIDLESQPPSLPPPAHSIYSLNSQNYPATTNKGEIDLESQAGQNLDQKSYRDLEDGKSNKMLRLRGGCCCCGCLYDVLRCLLCCCIFEAICDMCC